VLGTCFLLLSCAQPRRASAVQAADNTVTYPDSCNSSMCWSFVAATISTCVLSLLLLPHTYWMVYLQHVVYVETLLEQLRRALAGSSSMHTPSELAGPSSDEKQSFSSVPTGAAALRRTVC
jgi:hypothetical protein